MNCKDVHNDLIFYLDHELNEVKMEAVQKHLEVCDDCRDFLDVLKMQMQFIGEEKKQMVSPFFYTRLSAKIERQDELLISFSGRKNWIQSVVFACLLAIGILSGIYLGYLTSAPILKPTVDSRLVLMDDFEAEPIETFLLGGNENR